MELSPYEQQRQTPHLPQEDGMAVRLNWNALTAQFKCPVCLSILTDTMTFMECMHRFCSDCISKSLRIKRECPSCRAPCPSRRSLRRDENFDRLIKAIYPDRRWLEQQQDQLMVKLRSHHNMTALAESVSRGMEDQARHRGAPRGGRARRPTVEQSASSSSSEDSGEGDGEDPADSSYDEGDSRSPTKRRRVRETLPVGVEVQLLPLPGDDMLPGLQRQYLRTTPTCTVGHLAKYLALAFGDILDDTVPEGPRYKLCATKDGEKYHRLAYGDSLGKLLATPLPASQLVFQVFYAPA